jgi:endo-1,4-beta-xylanase
MLAAAGAAAQSPAVVLAAGFESGTAEGWGPRGTETVAVARDIAHSGSYSLLVTKRTLTWNGAIHELPGPLKAGGVYHISLWAMSNNGPARPRITLSVEKSFKDAAAAHSYVNVKTITLTLGEWSQLEADYTISGEPDLARVDFYVETPYKADSAVTPEDRYDFYIDDVTVTRLSAEEMISIQRDIPDLRTVLEPYFRIGAAVPPAFVDPMNIHSRLLIKHFSMLVAGNAMKPDALQPREGEFNWKDADAVVGFAGSTGMTVRGHTLLWHQQIPDWFFTDPKDPARPATRDLLLQRMKTHIQTVMMHFEGDVASWDVVNEVLSDRSGLRGADEGSKWLSIIGPDYIEKAFQYAREADPKAQLVINDYNLESDPRKLTEMYNLVKSLKAKKIPVDAVGFQMHISMYAPSVQEIRAAIEKIASLGVKVVVTEMDVSIYSDSSEQAKSVTPDLLQAQGKRYKELFDLFKAEAKKAVIDTVVMWGCADDDTWLDNFPVQGRPNAPLLFDRKLQAKPAFWAIVDPSKM